MSFKVKISACALLEHKNPKQNSVYISFQILTATKSLWTWTLFILALTLHWHATPRPPRVTSDLTWHRPSTLRKPCVGCEKTAEWTSHFTFIVTPFTPDWAALNGPPGPICLGATLHDRHWKTWNAPRHTSRLFVIKWNIKPLEAPSVMAPRRPLRRLSSACQVTASPIFYVHVKTDVHILWREKKRTKQSDFSSVSCAAPSRFHLGLAWPQSNLIGYQRTNIWSRLFTWCGVTLAAQRCFSYLFFWLLFWLNKVDLFHSS